MSAVGESQKRGGTRKWRDGRASYCSGEIKRQMSRI